MWTCSADRERVFTIPESGVSTLLNNYLQSFNRKIASMVLFYTLRRLYTMKYIDAQLQGCQSKISGCAQQGAVVVGC